jgi:hypothetical protein
MQIGAKHLENKLLKQRPWVACAMIAGSLGLALPLAFSSDARAVGVGAIKTEASAGVSPNRGGVAQPDQSRAVEVVVVWGFRLRGTMHDTRIASMRAGYGELIARDDCITTTCGFVMVKDGNVWRSSNILAATEAELIEKQHNMERDGTTLIIVHPNGSRRSVPSF